MRAVFSEVLPARLTPSSSPQFSRIDQEFSEQPQTSFVAEEMILAALGPDGVLRAFKTACTRISVRLPALW
jgi:hypothetical protein